METKVTEMLYGIYFAESRDGFNGPKGERQAGCVIREDSTDKDVFSDLVASDFLSQYQEYEIFDYGPSIHIHYKNGVVALVLSYEEDLEEV